MLPWEMCKGHSETAKRIQQVEQTDLDANKKRRLSDEAEAAQRAAAAAAAEQAAKEEAARRSTQLG